MEVLLRVSVLLIIIYWKFSLGDEVKVTQPPLKSCSQFNLKTLWTSVLRESPLVGTPLLIDVDGDSLQDIIAPSHSGEVWAIHGENGHTVDNWPFHIEGRSFSASPLAYDIDADGSLDVLLTTTDAEVVFLHTNGTLFHGETIKISPLRVKKDWYSLDKEYIQKLANEMAQKVGHRFQYNPKPFQKESSKPPLDITDIPYSQFDAQFGPESDPLYSRHQPGERPVGKDDQDESYIFVDPHVLASPVISDINEDGYNDELIVPVSYYFDRYQYGIDANLAKTGLGKEELSNYAASGLVVIDLKTRQILKEVLLSLTTVSSDQPSFLLAQPTVVKLAKGDPISVIIGSTSGQIFMFQGPELNTAPGFPVVTDSITSQVAVEDMTGDGTFELAVGDVSGNVICLDRNGKQLWEYNVKMPIESSVRFFDFHSDRSMEVIFVAKFGDVWILNGTTGKPTLSSPLSLNSLVHSSPLLLHLITESDNYHLTAIVPSISGLYVIDLHEGCVNRVAMDTEFVPHILQSQHIDPFNPGLEIIASSLTGQVVCISSGTRNPSDYEASIDTWPSDVLEGNGFTQKKSSFVLVCGRGLSTRDAHGKNFRFEFEIHDKFASKKTPRNYHILLTVGRKYVLLNETFVLEHSKQDLIYNPLTPPVPILATMYLKVCNDHKQCDTTSFTVRFNLIFQENIALCLALPFLALVAGYLWVLRNEIDFSLPTTVYDPTKQS